MPDVRTSDPGRESRSIGFQLFFNAYPLRTLRGRHGAAPAQHSFVWLLRRRYGRVRRPDTPPLFLFLVLSCCLEQDPSLLVALTKIRGVGSCIRSEPLDLLGQHQSERQHCMVCWPWLKIRTWIKAHRAAFLDPLFDNALSSRRHGV